MPGLQATARAWLWRLIRLAHHLDFAYVLPLIARLPLRLAFLAGGLRGTLIAGLRLDWRSVALGFRHIDRQSQAGFALLPGEPSEQMCKQWSKQRFVAEARDELEGRFIARGRLHEMQCTFLPPHAQALDRHRKRGLLLLTPHFDSFVMGITLLARSGAVVNSMSSRVTQDPRVDDAVKAHFHAKYRGMEQYLNGGKVLDMEDGLRPFYRMLEANEVLVVLGDSPVLAQGARMDVDFLGTRRTIAGGALRLAQHTGSDLGGFVCRYMGPGQYRLEMCPIGPAGDATTIEGVYRFFTEKIVADPGLWWAADLLPNLPPVAPQGVETQEV